MPDLPPTPLRPAWERAPDGWVPRSGERIEKMPDGRLMLDAAWWGDHWRIIAWEKADSPHLAALMARYPHLPRAVLAPYRAEVILKRWRSDEAWDTIRMIDAQREAWQRYHESAAA